MCVGPLTPEGPTLPVAHNLGNDFSRIRNTCTTWVHLLGIDLLGFLGKGWAKVKMRNHGTGSTSSAGTSANW
jgi:hypothetical protein